MSTRALASKIGKRLAPVLAAGALLAGVVGASEGRAAPPPPWYYKGTFNLSSTQLVAPCDGLFNDHQLEASFYLMGADRHVAVVHWKDLDDQGPQGSFLNGVTQVGRLGVSDLLFTKKVVRRDYRYEIESAGMWEPRSIYLETVVKVFDNAAPADADPICEVTADFLGSDRP